MFAGNLKSQEIPGDTSTLLGTCVSEIHEPGSQQLEMELQVVEISGEGGMQLAM